MKSATKAIHAGEPEPRIEGAVVTPIFQTAMFEYSGEADERLRYLRYNNSPNQEALHRKLAALEDAEAALVTASGMAAISSALLTVLKPGDHLLAQASLYGGTYSFITKYLHEQGVAFDFIDGSAPDSWLALLRPTTRAIYVEAITNPLMEVAHLDAVADFAQAHALVSMIDNTFATPINFRPAAWCFDLSLHSATKYLNGHSDLIAGAVMGRADLVDKVEKTVRYLGGSLDPHACFLLQRGLKTLAVRMSLHNENALRLAQFLEDHPAVQTVNYPGLESNTHHEVACTLFDGFGGMISMELTPTAKDADDFLHALRLPICAPSLGGIESLISRPAVTSHATLSPEVRRSIGIPEGLIRISVGIEDVGDLIEDFEQALSGVEKGRTSTLHF